MRKVLLRPIEKLIGQNDVARFVFRLERTDGADADDPGNPQFFHRPDIGAMIQLRRQDAVAASMPGQKNHLTTSQSSCEQVIGCVAERSSDSGPFLISE